jgi:thiol-disulfide isomerase/thioredoxin
VGSKGNTVGSVVVVTTPTCPNCRAMQPLVEAVALEHPDVPVVELDAAADPHAAIDLGIRAVPAYLVDRGGVEIARRVGRVSREELDELFVAASTGRTGRARVSRADRQLRLGVGALLAVAGLATATPALVMVAVALLLFGSWDLVVPARRREPVAR